MALPPHSDVDALQLRVTRLEKANRFWGVLAIAALGLALVGWQSPIADELRTHRIEVVDSRGVPMVVIDATSKNLGGTITMRDQLGERRVWLEAGETSHFGMVAGTSDAPAGGLGLTASREGAHLVVTGARAHARFSVSDEKPELDLVDENGKSRFRAPAGH